MQFPNKAARQDYILKQDIEHGGDVDVTWDQIKNKPAVVASGATQEAARNSIGAGTSSFSGQYKDLAGIPTTFAPEIGTSATTAMAGNTSLFSGNYSDLSGTPSTFAPTIGTTATTAMAGNKEATSTERGGVLKVAAPTIQVDDPVDDDNIREQFNNLVDALKSAGVFS